MATVPWQTRFKQLVEYKDAHGDCRVPKRYEENPQLAAWVQKMRKSYKKFQNGEDSPLTMERIQKLNDLGFEWQLRAVGRRSPRFPWQTHVENLKKYKAQFGNCRVPRTWKENVPLANWVFNTRRRYAILKKGEKSSLTSECIEALNGLGFEWQTQTGRSKTPGSDIGILSGREAREENQEDGEESHVESAAGETEDNQAQGPHQHQHQKGKGLADLENQPAAAKRQRMSQQEDARELFDTGINGGDDNKNHAVGATHNEVRATRVIHQNDDRPPPKLSLGQRLRAKFEARLEVIIL